MAPSDATGLLDDALGGDQPAADAPTDREEDRKNAPRRPASGDARRRVAPVENGALDALVPHDALDKMLRLDERQANVVEYRHFGGLSSEETAQPLRVSSRMERDWTIGRAWLRRELSRGDDA